MQVLDGLVWDVLPNDPAGGLEVWCQPCPEMMELSVLREVIMRSRIMSLDLHRGDFGEGRIGKDAGPAPSASRSSLLKA